LLDGARGRPSLWHGTGGVVGGGDGASGGVTLGCAWVFLFLRTSDQYAPVVKSTILLFAVILRSTMSTAGICVSVLGAGCCQSSLIHANAVGTSWKFTYCSTRTDSQFLAFRGYNKIYVVALNVLLLRLKGLLRLRVP